MKSKVLTYLGFAQKSGNISSGFDTVSLGIKKKNIYLVILAEDVAENTKEKIVRLCEANKIDYRIALTVDEISNSVGKSNRAIIGINNRKFAKTILNCIDQ